MWVWGLFCSPFFPNEGHRDWWLALTMLACTTSQPCGSVPAIWVLMATPFSTSHGKSSWSISSPPTPSLSGALFSSPTQLLADQHFINQSEVMQNTFYMTLGLEMLTMSTSGMQSDIWASEYTVHKTIPQIYMCIIFHKNPITPIAILPISCSPKLIVYFLM